MVLKRTPFAAGHPDLAAAGVVHVHRQPAQRFVVAGGYRHLPVPAFEAVFPALGRDARIESDFPAVGIPEGQFPLRRRRHAVETAFLNPVQFASRHPMALVIAHRDFVVRTHRHAVRRAEPGGEHLELQTVPGHLDQRALVRRGDVRFPRRTFRKVEIAPGIRLQIEREFVVVRCHHDVVVEVLIKIRFAVVVQVMQARDLIAAQHINRVVHNLQAKRLKHSRGITPPGQFLH